MFFTNTWCKTTGFLASFFCFAPHPFPFPLSNKATFHIKYVGCLIGAKCISQRVGPRQGLCSLSIICRDIECHPLPLAPSAIALHVALKCIFNRYLSTFSLVCLFISWLLKRKKAILRCSTTFSNDFENFFEKYDKKTWKTGHLGNLVVTRTYHMSRLGLWVTFYLGTAKAPRFTTHLQRGKLLRGILPPQQVRKLGQPPFNLIVPDNC